MKRLTENKIILVTRATRLAELTARFNTVGQARFYIEHLGADFSDYLAEDDNYRKSLAMAHESLSAFGRLQVLERSLLPNFIFGPQDVVVVLGQDGLVANTVKYLDGQSVIGVNPDPSRWEGKLLPFTAEELAGIIPEVFRGTRPTIHATMAKAELNNGQKLYAVNDLFIGVRSHTSARYVVESNGLKETHSSSGVIVSTGVGSSGWFKSLLTGAAAIGLSSGISGGKVHRPKSGFRVKTDFPWNSDYLHFTVREPFPSPTTGASLVFGKVTVNKPLVLTSLMSENGVIFSDGIEKDFLEFNSGTQATLIPAERKGILIQ